MSKNITVNEILKEWDYFLSRLNFKDSFLDGRSLQFMSEFKGLLESVVKPNWQPIESVPKNGSYLVCGGILLSELGESVANVIAKVEGKSYSGENCYTVADGCYYEAWVDSPTHWMPLPPEVTDE